MNSDNGEKQREHESDGVTDEQADSAKEKAEEDLSTRKASVGEVWKVAIPIIISQASMGLLGLVDTYFMGWIGPDAQAAVGFGTPTTFSILSLFFGLFSGLTTFVGQYFGAKRYSDCGKMLWHTLYLAAVLGIFCAIFINPLIYRLLLAMGTNPEIFDMTYDYLKIRMWVCPIMFISFSLLSFLRGIGDMKTPAVVSCLIVLLNIPLTYVFAFGLGPIPAFGVAGAAIGTVIAQFVEMVAYGIVVFNRQNASKFITRKMVRPEARAYLDIVKIALPVGVCWAIEEWGWVLYGLYITTLPKEQSAANAIVQNFMFIAWMPGLAISIATTTLVGQYLGAKNVRSAEQSAHYAIIMSIACLLSLGILCFLFRYQLAGMFSDDGKVIDVAVNLFYFLVVYQVFDAAGVTISGALRGAGDTRFPMVIGFVGIWGIMVPSIFILNKIYDLGIYGAWGASSFAIIVSGCLYYARFKQGKWKTMSISE